MITNRKILWFFHKSLLTDPQMEMYVVQSAGADPGFFLEGDIPLADGVTDWWCKQILKANTKEKAFD